MSPALILGGASCVWDDYIRLTALAGPWRGPIIAVNRVGCWWPYRLEHWASAHLERMAAWREVRERNGYSMDFRVWGEPERLALDWADELVSERWGMSSSGTAIVVALRHLRRPAVLCGVPLDERAHFDQAGKWTGATGFRAHWRNHAPKLRPAVRSMSGWTRDFLGEPTPEWLDGYCAKTA